MDKHTEAFFKSILAEEPADYSRPPRFAGSYFGKFRYYLSQFRHIDYREAFSNMISGTKELGSNIMSVLNKKIEKPAKAEASEQSKVDKSSPDATSGASAGE